MMSISLPGPASPRATDPNTLGFTAPYLANSASSSPRLAKLAALTGNSGYSDAAKAALTSMRAKMAQTPVGFARWLSALDFVLSDSSELAIVRADALPMLHLVRSTYRPNLIVAAASGATSGDTTSSVPLLTDRPAIDGAATGLPVLATSPASARLRVCG